MWFWPETESVPWIRKGIRDIAESETYDWPLSSFVPGVLERFDLPDCYLALKEQNLRQIEPRGANGGT